MPLIGQSDLSVPVVVQARSRVAPPRAFDIVVPIDLSRIFTRWGPFPGVRGVRDQGGPWDAVGRTRTPLLTDGSTADERITELTAPSSFAYEITEFTNNHGVHEYPGSARARRPWGVDLHARWWRNGAAVDLRVPPASWPACPRRRDHRAAVAAGDGRGDGQDGSRDRRGLRSDVTLTVAAGLSDRASPPVE